jgi:gliding motility-associated protein GldE
MDYTRWFLDNTNLLYISADNAPIIAFYLISIIFLLFLSALISGSEIAFFGLTPTQLEQLKHSDSKVDRKIVSLLEKPKDLLAAILVGNNFVNIGIVIISGFAIDELFNFKDDPALAFIIQVVVLTSLILLFGEILPKVYATRNSLSVARSTFRLLLILKKLFYPIIFLLVKSSSFLDKRLSVKMSGSLSVTDITDAIDLTSPTPQTDEEIRILKGIVRISDVEVSEVMTSRTDIAAIAKETPFSELIHLIQESGYSRIPVYDGSLDHILGILYIKDLLPHLEANSSFNWIELLRKPFFVPENKNIGDLLTEFRSIKNHLAIVVDEYGGTLGLVSLEDIIEEVVGEINDEFDTETDGIFHVLLDANTHLFDGKTLLNDFCRILSIPEDTFDPIKGEAETLAGLVLEILGRFPVKGEALIIKDYNVSVEAIESRRIKSLKVWPVEKVII